MLTPNEKDIVSEMVNGTSLENRQRMRSLSDEEVRAEIAVWKEAKLPEVINGIEFYTKELATLTTLKSTLEGA